MRRFLVPFLVAILLLHSGSVLAWGSKGHRIITALAEPHLTPAARAAVTEILAGEDLGSAAIWADTMRSSASNPEFWSQAAHWHYVNVPAGQDYADAKVDPRGDAYVALQAFAAILHNEPVPAGPVRDGLVAYFGGLDPQSPELKRFALRFLLHIIADLQQPLHSAYADDRGGNAIDVLWLGEPGNLHNLWDSQLVEYAKLNVDAYARRLESWRSHMPASDIHYMETAEPLEWMRDSRKILDRMYSWHDGRNEFGTDYAATFVPSVELQLLKGGLRTAYVLNSLFGGWPIGIGEWRITPTAGPLIVTGS